MLSVASNGNTKPSVEHIASFPVAVETLGALCEEATAFLKDLGRRIAATTKEHRSFEFLMQRVSVVVQRGNAACVLGTTSDNNYKLEDLFYIL